MKTFKEFADALGKRESGNDYKAVNMFGYLGKYQFGKARLWDCGISLDGWSPRRGIPKTKIQITKAQFLNSPDLQEKIFVIHINMWLDVIKKKYLQYHNREISGVLVTISGMAAGLHLKGEGSTKHPGLKQFLQTGKNNTDAYGTGIAEYISKFGGYNLYFPNKDELRKYIRETGEYAKKVQAQIQEQVQE